MTGRGCIEDRVARLRVLIAQDEDGAKIDERSLESALLFLDDLARGGAHERPATFVRQDGVVRLLWSVPTGERPHFQYGISFVMDGACQVVWSDETVEGGLASGCVARDRLEGHIRTVGLEAFVRKGERTYQPG